jgi:hypothetical protein
MCADKTSFDDLYGGKYLTAADIEDDIVGEIENAVVEKMRDGSHKVVVTLEGEDRGIVLNKTRAKALLDMSGSKDYADWIGLKVKVTTVPTAFGAETVQSIAFKKLPPKKKSLKEDLDDEIPHNFEAPAKQ